MNASRNPIYVVGEIEVDPLRGRLRRGQSLQALRQKPFQVLVYLLERRGQLVTKQELMESVWKDTAVTDDALVQCVMEIRKALGDDSRSPQLVQTLPKLGYRFIAPVEERWEGMASVESEQSLSLALEYEEEVPDSPPQLALAPPAIGRKWALLGLAAALGVALVAAGLVGLNQYRQSLPQPAAALPEKPGTTSLAVMYFQNQTGSAELEWLREGLCDMLITDLSRSSKLQVLSRQHLGLLIERASRSREARISSGEALEIARRAHVQNLVMGSFASVGGRIRVDAQLQQVATGQVLAAESLVIEKPEQLLSRVDLLSANLLKHMQNSAAAPALQAGLADLRTDNLDAYRYYSLAVEKARALHSADAIELLKKAIALDPQFAMAHARIGYTYAVSWGTPDKGKPYLEKAFRFSARLTEKDKLTIRGWYAIARLDYAEAISVFREIVQKYPQEIEAYYQLSALLQGEEQHEQALDVLTRGLQFDPDAEQLYNGLGTVYSALGQHDKAISAHQRLVALSPQEPNAHDSLGMSYEAAGQYESAMEEYNRALALDPEFEIAVVHLGNAYYKLGQYQAALRQYERYIQVAPSNLERARGYNSIARVQRARQRLDLAGAAVAKQRSMGESPTSEPLMLALDRGDLRQAERLFQGLSTPWRVNGRGRREPQRYRHYFRGHLALGHGDHQQALASFQEAVRHTPPLYDLDPLEDCLANAYLQLGQLDEAIAEYQRVLRLNPRYPLAHFGLAQAYERKGALSEARSEYKRFLSLWEKADRDIPQVQQAQARLRGRAAAGRSAEGPS